MPSSTEQHAREEIDKQLLDAGWIIQDMDELNLDRGRGIAVREFPLKKGHGTADYLLYVDHMALGVIEAKKEGKTLTGSKTRVWRTARTSQNQTSLPAFTIDDK